MQDFVHQPYARKPGPEPMGVAVQGSGKYYFEVELHLCLQVNIRSLIIWNTMYLHCNIRKPPEIPILVL